MSELEISLSIETELPKTLTKDVQIPFHFAEGSYFENPLPSDFEFVYIIVTNTSTKKRTIVDVKFELCLESKIKEKSKKAKKSEKSSQVHSTADEKRLEELPLGEVLSKFSIDTDSNACNNSSFFQLSTHFANIYGMKIEPEQSIVFACLREHLASVVRYTYPIEKTYLRASCEFLDGRKAYSTPALFDADYPKSPLQDIELLNYHSILKNEQSAFHKEYAKIKKEYKSLKEYSSLHYELGIHLIKEKGKKAWLMREYAPDATSLYFLYDSDNFGNWKSIEYTSEGNGYWIAKAPYREFFHGMYYELHVYGKYLEGKQVRVPAFANWVWQNQEDNNQWCARFWHPENSYTFKNKKPKKPKIPVIYEAHVGIAKHNLEKSSESELGFGSYAYFREKLLPMIKEAGYNTIQFMAIPEHPLYKSFGYQVSSYFAPSHRFGTLNDFKELVDAAHGLGITVLLDIVHSHSTPNTEQGLPRYDTGDFLFTYERQTQWGTIFFDYNKEITRRFLLSNCRYWMEEFQIDGFRFDAVGSMVFVDEGFDDDFSHVNACFYTKDNQNRRNESGILYLQLANTLIHEMDKNAITIAEEFSGFPGITSKAKESGLGFDYRFAMGIPDVWAKNILHKQPSWKLWHECTNHRIYDKTISYVECHDQSINGEDAMIWRMIGDDMYFHMSPFSENWKVSRGVALSKLMKLLVISTTDKGYMNFMGNEFGHPEWIDADENPYRQWSLREDSLLHYKALAEFDKDMIKLLQKENPFPCLSRYRDILEESVISKINQNDSEQINIKDDLLLFERGKLLIAFNFHETKASMIRSYVRPGKYIEIFSTDEIKYAGHANLSIVNNVEYFTKAYSGEYEQEIELYMPPLTALILKRED